MKQLGRRTVLGYGLRAGALLLLGCEVGQQDASTSADTPGAPAAWVVNPPSFAVGGGGTFNLANTLPVGVVRGGVFDVSSSGAKLPTGMTLTSAGILSVGSASVGSVAGVVFTYASP